MYVCMYVLYVSKRVFISTAPSTFTLCIAYQHIFIEIFLGIMGCGRTMSRWLYLNLK